ncbi:MAG TPA: TetR family transcriptional regulator [Solirubrobacteraceae bacterium]|nr:TetR family transcriptional regulator [Solirubrobacteraceae bacterium]
MAEPVKSPRRYDSPRRREQAAATRRDILTAAKPLFERDGYAATTMAAIAAEAGVATKTVYAAFESKSGVLRALWHLLLRGDQDEAPVAQREWYRRLLEERDPERKLQLAGGAARAVKERAGALMFVIRSAAPTEPDTAELWARIQSDFHDNQRVIVESLHTAGSLRADLDVAHASDILWTLNHPDTWHLLVGERGWSPAQWEHWFVETARAQLLEPSP